CMTVSARRQRFRRPWHSVHQVDADTVRSSQPASTKEKEEPMTGTTASATITDAERAQVERANARTATPVVFIHGLWLLASSWGHWAELFGGAGYVALTPDWPDDPESVEVARAEPEALAGKTLNQVADHTTEVITA